MHTYNLEDPLEYYSTRNIKGQSIRMIDATHEDLLHELGCCYDKILALINAMQEGSFKDAMKAVDELKKFMD